MNILVFGAYGLIGGPLVDGLYGAVRACRSVDICDRSSVRDEIESIKPDAVINAAWPIDDYGNESVSAHIEGFHNVIQESIDYWKCCCFPGCLISIGSIYATMLPRFEIYPETMGVQDPQYSAAKSAIVQLTRFYAKSVLGSGIRLNCVSPGGVYRNEPDEFVKAYSSHTNHAQMLPQKAIVQACRFLLNCRWVTGQNVVVADGFDL